MPPTPPSLTAILGLASAPPVLNSSYTGNVDAGVVLVVCCILMYVYIKSKPPGIAYTYCWLGCCTLSLIATDDAKALAACIGVGLNISWYFSQAIYRDLWPGLLPYWEEYLPKWSIATCIRFGDIMLHPVPALYFLPYLRHVDLRIALYSLFLERWYFILVEKQFIGSGSVCNEIYDIRPRAKVGVFITCQLVSATTILLVWVSNYRGAWLVRRFLQLCVLSFFAVLAIVRTDRQIFLCTQRCCTKRESSSKTKNRIDISMEWITGGKTADELRAELSLAVDEFVLRSQESFVHQWDETGKAFESLTMKSSCVMGDMRDHVKEVCTTAASRFSLGRSTPIVQSWNSREENRSTPIVQSWSSREESPREKDARRRGRKQRRRGGESLTGGATSEEAVLWARATDAFSMLVRLRKAKQQDRVVSSDIPEMRDGVS